MAWKVVAGSATGSSHSAAGQPCQDAFDSYRRDKWLIAAVCDGAGSARFSDRGASHAARSLCRTLSDAIPFYGSRLADPRNYWETRIADAIGKARTTLVSDYVRGDATLRDFHATIVGVVMGPEFGTFFQVGDGAGVAVLGEGWDDVVVSLPENGQYADETFFYTEERWREHLRFTPVPAEARLITLMTDGAMSFAMARGHKGLDRNFIEPVSRYLEGVDTGTGSRALAGTLDDPRTHAITSDDKTLLWALREG